MGGGGELESRGVQADRTRSSLAFRNDNVDLGLVSGRCAVASSEFVANYARILANKKRISRRKELTKTPSPHRPSGSSCNGRHQLGGDDRCI